MQRWVRSLFLFFFFLPGFIAVPTGIEANVREALQKFVTILVEKRVVTLGRSGQMDSAFLKLHGAVALEDVLSCSLSPAVADALRSELLPILQRGDVDRLRQFLNRQLPAPCLSPDQLEFPGWPLTEEPEELQGMTVDDSISPWSHYSSRLPISRADLQGITLRVGETYSMQMRGYPPQVVKISELFQGRTPDYLILFVEILSGARRWVIDQIAYEVREGGGTIFSGDHRKGDAEIVRRRKIVFDTVSGSPDLFSETGGEVVHPLIDSPTEGQIARIAETFPFDLLKEEVTRIIEMKGDPDEAIIWGVIDEEGNIIRVGSEAHLVERHYIQRDHSVSNPYGDLLFNVVIGLYNPSASKTYAFDPTVPLVIELFSSRGRALSASEGGGLKSAIQRLLQNLLPAMEFQVSEPIADVSSSPESWTGRFTQQINQMMARFKEKFRYLKRDDLPGQ